MEWETGKGQEGAIDYKEAQGNWEVLDIFIILLAVMFS